MPLGTPELDKLFCLWGRHYSIPKLLLKAVAIAESALDVRAFRHEPSFWISYKDAILKKWPELAGRDVAEVSSSFGLLQLMFTTAYGLGYRGDGEGLYDPTVNVQLGTKLLRQNLDYVIAKKFVEKFPWLSPLQVALCLYNGGYARNPDDKGELRNIKYATKVLKIWEDLKAKEKECDE
jgi:hypothetical protein